MIPLARPHTQYLTHQADIDLAVKQVLDSGVYVLGAQVEAFEKAFAEYCGVSHGVGVNSGTDAITLALRAWGIGTGDRVVTVSHTAVATIAAIIATGATPVVVDIDPATYTLDPDQLETVMDERVKAIIPVHLYGNVADLTGICEIAGGWEVPVVEDCAQAAGASLGERRAGSIGLLGCFSFYPTKNLGALGDGGMVITDNDELADGVARLRQYGWDQERVADRPGFNSRLDELQAAVLMAKLKYLDAANARRIEIAERYSNAFADLPLVTPTSAPEATHVYHLYVIATEARSRLRAALAEHGIQSAIHYPVPVHREPGYADRVEILGGGLPHTDHAVERILSLPIYPGLTDAEVEKVIDAVTSTYS